MPKRTKRAYNWHIPRTRIRATKQRAAASRWLRHRLARIAGTKETP